MVGDLRADELEQNGWRHRKAHSQHRLVGLNGVAGRAPAAIEPGGRGGDSRRKRARRARGRRSCGASHRPHGGEGFVVRRGRASSTSGRTATGLKKCMPTTRSGCSSPAPISVTESDDVFVSTHSGETTRSSRREDVLLDRHLLEDGLEDEIAAGEDFHSVPPVTSEPRKRALLSARRPRRTRSASSSAIHAIASSTCSWVRSRSTTGTSRRRRKRSASCRASEARSTMPTR